MTTSVGISRYRDPRQEMVDMFPISTGDVLDVGCAEGAFSAAVRDRYPELTVTGIDAEAEASDLLPGAVSAFFHGSYPMAVPDGQRYDCVVFNDVLEHMADPWTALRRTHAVLRPGGVLLASIPNVRYLPVLARLAFADDFTYTDVGVLDRTHLRFFTGRTIRSLFEDTGFVVETMAPTHLLTVKQLFYPRIPWVRGAVAKANPLFAPLARRFPGLFARQFAVIARAPAREERGTS